MSYRVLAAKCRFCCVLASALACTLVLISPATSPAQVIESAVGGVSINAAGIVNAATLDNMNKLSNDRRLTLQKIPGDLNGAAEMRKISLRRLEAAIDDCAKNNKPLPDAIKYLAGLQQIRYVFVYPEQKDIVLVGPGEGWKVDARGNVVGVTTGRPVMLLDDLLVAMRTAKAAADGGITCSINPTQEGVARMNGVQIQAGASPAAVAEACKKALGLQQITLHGVPDTSHFARVLVAADYRMKRISMALDSSPVRGLPSYLQMAKPSRKTVSPRFWLEPKFDALLRDADGLAFELCGSTVKAMTEEDFFTANGDVKHTGKPSPMAQKWANIMTDKYAELAVADPIFGQLQNCMELAVVGAIIVKDRLPEKAGYDLPGLLGSPAVKTDVYNAPKQVPSVASVRGRLIAVSGGVTINSWSYADKLKTSEKVAAVRTKAAFAKNAGWWQN
jgi:hypothetical protein